MNPVDQQLAYQQMIGQRIDSGNQYALGIARLMQEGRVATAQLMQGQQRLGMENRRLNLDENEAPLKLQAMRQNIAVAKQQLAHNLIINPTQEAEAQLKLQELQDAAETDTVVAQQIGNFSSALNTDLANNREAVSNGQSVSWDNTDALLRKYPRLAMDKRILSLRDNADNALRYHEQFNQTQETRNLNRAASLRVTAAGMEAQGSSPEVFNGLRRQADLLEQGVVRSTYRSQVGTSRQQDYSAFLDEEAKIKGLKLPPAEEQARINLARAALIPGGGDTAADKAKRAMLTNILRVKEKAMGLAFDETEREALVNEIEQLYQAAPAASGAPAPTPTPAPVKPPKAEVDKLRKQATEALKTKDPAAVKAKFRELTGEEL